MYFVLSITCLINLRLQHHDRRKERKGGKCAFALRYNVCDKQAMNNIYFLSVLFSGALAGDDQVRITPSLRSRKGKF